MYIQCIAMEQDQLKEDLVQNNEVISNNMIKYYL